jgi:shikimate kinase
MVIFLIGFMGCGKTFWGKSWSERYDYQFIDLDDTIEKIEGETVSDIFEKKGEPGFRLIESIVLQNLNPDKNSIIACGGGTPCFYSNMEWMNKHGKTVYLKAPAPLLLQRLTHLKQPRPLIKGLSQHELESYVHKKLSERIPFYELAHLTLDAEYPDEKALFT